MKHRIAIEAVISHIKAEHRMQCNDLTHSTGHRNNAVLVAAGYNFRFLHKLRDFSRFLTPDLFAANLNSQN